MHILYLLQIIADLIRNGNECSGYVEAIGKDVTKVKVGDPVWVIHNPGYGACAEYICVDEQYVTSLPSGMNPLNAVGLLNYFIGYCLLHEAGRGTDGKSLYIPGGAGGVGTALIKMALADGWEVISAADTEEKCFRIADERKNRYEWIFLW